MKLGHDMREQRLRSGIDRPNGVCLLSSEETAGGERENSDDDWTGEQRGEHQMKNRNKFSDEENIGGVAFDHLIKSY